MQVIEDAGDARSDRRMQEVVELRHQLPFPHQDAFVDRNRHAREPIRPRGRVRGSLPTPEFPGARRPAG